MLLEAYPEGALHQTKDGELPLQYTDHNGMLYLHRACHDGSPIELLKLFVNAYPQECTIKDDDGKLPSDYLKEHGVAAACTDKDGMLPLHHACRDGASHDLLQLIVNAHPESCTKKDTQGMLP